MLGKLRSSFSHRESRPDTTKRERLGESNQDENLRAGSTFGWVRRKCSASIPEPVSVDCAPVSSRSSNSRTQSLAALENPGPLGLHVVHEPEGPANVDIIFVHGLGGGSYRTWSKDHDPKFFWPGLWLPQEPKCKEARIFTYGYDAEVTGPRSLSNITDFARALVYQLHNGRACDGEAFGIGRVPIIFVAHSMGGLVVKKAYLQLQNDQKYSSIFKSIRGIVFLATPHRGSHLASTLNSILKFCLHTTKEFISDLKENSAALEEINEQFRHVAPKLSIVSFYETLDTAIGLQRFKIVQKASSMLGDRDEEVCPLLADHHDVCKFNDRNDQNYLSVRNTLMNYIDRVSGSDFGVDLLINDKRRKSEQIEKFLSVSYSAAEDLEIFYRRRVPGSCEWMLHDRRVENWLEEINSSQILWYCAPPASGKSVLSSFLVSHLQANATNCQYFFFRHGYQGKCSASDMVKSLAIQIALTVFELRDNFLSISADGLWETNNYEWIWAKLFESMLFRLRLRRPLYWIIDALDECESPSTVVKLFSTLSRSQTTVKVFLTSRQTEALPRLFKTRLHETAWDMIDGSSECLNHDDIRLLVDLEINATHASADLKKGIKRDILQNAEGNFLWSSLVLEELHKCHTEEDMYQALEHMPRDMKTMYERMELAIVESSTKSSVVLGKMILQWATCAPRPLTLKELDQALKKDHPGILDLKRTINLACGQFVLVDNTEHVTVIHQTAREYLTTVSKSCIAVNRQEAHETLLLKSLSYLCDPSLETRLGETRNVTISEDLFAQFAAASWMHHLRHANALSDEVLDKLVQFFSNHSLLNWIQILALTRQLGVLVNAARELTSFASRIRKLNMGRNTMLHHLSVLKLLENWAKDLVRIPPKFSRYLLEKPELIKEVIPALCPSASVIYRQFYRERVSHLKVSGVSNVWNDAFARFTMPQDVPAWKILCSGQRIATLSHGGTIYVWSSIDFSMISTLHHGEPVIEMCLNSGGSMLVSYGLERTIIWDLPSGDILSTTQNPRNSRAMSLIFADGDTKILAAADDRTVRILTVSPHKGIWHALDDNLMKEPIQTAGAFINTPKCMAISSNGTQIGVCYRSFPLSVWGLDTCALIGRCGRASSGMNGTPSPDDWFAVDFFTWNPVSEHILGLYKDKTMFKWHPISDENQEVKGSVDEISVSPDGKLFVTSDSSGTVKIWNFACFTVIYQLSSGDLVSCLTFSPDCTRFYDLRGTTITAWEPNALVRFAESDGTFSDAESEFQSGTPTLHVSAAAVQSVPNVTSLALAPNGLRYATGDEDGCVKLWERPDSPATELTHFHNVFSVEHLLWSQDGRSLVAADLGGDIRIIQFHHNAASVAQAESFRLLPSPKLDLDGYAIRQLLLDPPATQLLAISDGMAQSWDITQGRLEHSVVLNTGAQRGWLNHPTKTDCFIGIGHDGILIMRWAGLQQESVLQVSPITFALNKQPSFPEASYGPSHDTCKGRKLVGQDSTSTCMVYKSMVTQDRKHVLAHLRMRSALGRVQKKLLILKVSALDAPRKNTEEEQVSPLEIPQDIAERVEFPLGILSDSRFVFFDHDLWVCSISIDPKPSSDSFRRHFFIPRDWTSLESVEYCCLAPDGTLLCPQDDKVVVLKETPAGNARGGNLAVSRNLLSSRSWVSGRK